MKPRSAILLVVAGLGTGCVSVVQKPCSTGGDPARDKPFTGRIEKKQCEQRRGKAGRDVNHGAYREWYPNGRLALEGEYREGARSGKWFEWDEQGKLLSERWFENGKEVPTRAAQAAAAAGAASVSPVSPESASQRNTK
ncbi:MAG: hypothetical protein NDJ89_17770 [Oligoflexia bacterium]|nr:hypothetical protein [Oligoflexia bacterium]